MKLPAAIFLVWAAQAQFAASTTTTPTTETTTTTTTVASESTALGTTGSGTTSLGTTTPVLPFTGSIGTTSSVSSSVPTSSAGTTSSTASSCTATEPPAPLLIAGAKPCIATKLNDQTIQFTSPKFPKNYPNSVKCEANTSSAGPRFLEITPKVFYVHKSDELIIKGPFGYEKRIQNADLNNSISLPSAYAKFEFTSSDRKTMQGFKVNIRSRTNSCQRICSLQAGSTGYITYGVHGADTFCEWWMEAPTGCFIQMKFKEFDVGPPPSKDGPWSCEGDYVGVDRNGDRSYDRPNSKTFCGSSLPTPIRSVDNKINVLFNGRDGGHQGFKIKYTVVC